jgi:hypothetical protein
LGEIQDWTGIDREEKVLADRSGLWRIVHVEDRIAGQSEVQDAAWKEKQRSRGNILVAVAPCNARMQSWMIKSADPELVPLVWTDDLRV